MNITLIPATLVRSMPTTLITAAALKPLVDAKENVTGSEAV